MNPKNLGQKISDILNEGNYTMDLNSGLFKCQTCKTIATITVNDDDEISIKCDCNRQ